jgi:hypothetical protein
VDFTDCDFHVEPFLKLVLLRPERAHLGQCVTIDHVESFPRNGATAQCQNSTKETLVVRCAIAPLREKSIFTIDYFNAVEFTK